MCRVNQYQGAHKGPTIAIGNQNAGLRIRLQRPVKSRASGGTSASASPVPLVRTVSAERTPNQTVPCHFARSMNRAKDRTAQKLNRPTKVSAMTIPLYA